MSHRVSLLSASLLLVWNLSASPSGADDVPPPPVPDPAISGLPALPAPPAPLPPLHRLDAAPLDVPMAADPVDPARVEVHHAGPLFLPPHSTQGIESVPAASPVPQQHVEHHIMESVPVHSGRVEDHRFELPLSPAPAGTLGRTYQKISHPVPEDEHPRTAMLAVRDGGTIKHLSVSGMGGFRMKSGVWLFESNRPLSPGVCGIVRVEARHHPRDIEPYDTRFVRLIPGRIVYLQF